MAITQAELAEKWGLTPGRISQLVAAGMPLTSLEEAQRFRELRSQQTGFPQKGEQMPSANVEEAEQGGSTINPDGFNEVVERQRQLVKVARNQYLQAIRDKSPLASRLYSSYDRTIQTLMKLEREASTRSVASREFIRTEHAIERYGSILAELRQMLDQGELEIAPKANPENPAKALKAYRNWKEKVLRSISRAEDKEGVNQTPSDDKGL
jgi:plasmid maintenance system antidote protein VapI